MSDFDAGSGSREVLEQALEHLAAAPGDHSLIESFVSTLEAVEPEQRADAAERANAALAADPDALSYLGIQLYIQTFSNCDALSARAYLAALRVDPTSLEALDGFRRALRFVERLEDAEGVVDEALATLGPQVHLQVEGAWAEWLMENGHEDRGQALIEQSYARALGDVKASPEDPVGFATLASVIQLAEGAQRADVERRARDALSDRPQDLLQLGMALARATFGGDLIGARVLLDAMRADPSAFDAFDSLVLALSGTVTAAAWPIIEEALALTANDPRLLSRWAYALEEHGEASSLKAMLPRGSEYGRCRCSGAIEPRFVQIRHGRGDHLLENVPQGECPVCGAVFYKAHVLAFVDTWFEAHAE